MKKNSSEDKRVRISYILTKIKFTPPCENHLKSLSRRISMLCTNFLKIVVGNDFVNKSTKLSFEQICCKMMSQFSSRS